MTYNDRRARALEAMDEYARLANQAAFSTPVNDTEAIVYAQLGILRGMRELLDTEQCRE